MLKAPLGSITLLGDSETLRAALDYFGEKQRRDSTHAAAIRAKAVLHIFQRQEPELQRKKLFQPLMQIEMPLVRVLSAMECTGICMDRRVYDMSKRPLLRRQEEVLEVRVQ